MFHNGLQVLEHFRKQSVDFSTSTIEQRVISEKITIVILLLTCMLAFSLDNCAINFSLSL